MPTKSALISYRHISIIIILLLSSFTNTYPQNFQNYVAKRGGVCFRTDDDQDIYKYLEYAAIFNKYNVKFNLAINLGMSAITPAYISGLKEIQANGNEILDHTPQHRTNFFTTILPTDCYVNNPGVQRISGNKIELKYIKVSLADSKRSGYVNINGDIVTSSNGIFSSFSMSDCYLYFPSLDKLVLIDEVYGWINQDTVRVFDFWRNSINLGSHKHIQFYNFDFNHVHLTVDALKVLAEESIRLADYYGLKRPHTWVWPGGYFPQFDIDNVKQALEELDYKSADVDPYSMKVFDENNKNNDKQFGMFWGDFFDDSSTLQQCKEIIAERVAKHYVVFGHNHFRDLSGGWEGFLERTDQLIQWCITNNIPIRTYSEWADILYNHKSNPYENIIPPLNVDLDSNSVPDGYTRGDGALCKSDGVPTINDYSFSITSTGNICLIRDLGGIEKDKNDFEIWTKGAPGDSIEISFKIGEQYLVYKFPAESTNWKKYNLLESVNGNSTLDIPDNISLIDVSIDCSDYSSGVVKISGMKLTKFAPLPVELVSFLASSSGDKVNLKWSTATELNNRGFVVQKLPGFESERLQSPELNWDDIGFVAGSGNSVSPKYYYFTDQNIGGSKFTYRLKQIDNDGSYKYSDKIEIDISPDKFELYQNYPNPFNPSTTIKYSIPEKSFVSLKVYDILGNEITTLVNKEQPIGYHYVDFYAPALSSGIYFYRLKTGSYFKTKKMIILK